MVRSLLGLRRFGSYLYNSEKKIFESYEDAESLGLKCKYVLDHQLRGVMFWIMRAIRQGRC